MLHVQLMQFDSAEADCDKALKLELSVKTLLRRGTARRGQQDVEGARRDFKHALNLEPNNRSAQPKQACPMCLRRWRAMLAWHLHQVLHRCCSCLMLVGYTRFKAGPMVLALEGTHN